MLARGDALVAIENGENARDAGKYSSLREAGAKTPMVAVNRRQVARHPRVCTLAIPRRTRPDTRTIRKRASASDIGMPTKLRLTGGMASRRRPEALR
jgi:hypothetical protein